jgi:hypothetical protein
LESSNPEVLESFFEYGKELRMRKFVFLLAALVVMLHADATISSITRIKMSAAMLTSEVRGQTDYRADMKADDDTVKITSIISPKPQHMGTITRLDKELMWNVSHDQKTYTEGPLKPPLESLKTEVKTGGAPDSSMKMRIVKSEFSVKKLDSTKTINGFPCAGYDANWTLVTQDSGGHRTTNVMDMVEWTTPYTDVIKQAQADEMTFNKAYMAKVGLNINPEESKLMGTQYLAGMMGGTDKDFAAQADSFATEMAKIQGYPIVTDLKWSIVDTSKNAAAAPQPTTQPGPFGMPMPNLGGMLANKIASNQENGVGFSSYREIRAISVGAVPDSHFEVPTGYKKSN